MAIYTPFTSIESEALGMSNKNKKRGLNVYTMSELVDVAGRTKQGEMVSGTVQMPWFGLDPQTRTEIYKKCDVVLGLVTGRANRISTLEWQVTVDSKNLDKTEQELKNFKQLYTEYDDQTIKSAAIRLKCIAEIRMVLPDVRPDLTNFDRALLRYKKRVNAVDRDKTSEIEDWILEPNKDDAYEDYIKKWVSDLLVHGSFSQYKEYNPDTKRLENIYSLPGGSMVPMKSMYVGGAMAYFQILPAMDVLAYFKDEISYSTYMPSSTDAYGDVPLDALVNKVAESLFFDKLAADQADGTKPPEKLVVMSEASPFGDLGAGDIPQMPISKAEKARIEEIMNTPRKNAVKVLTGGFGVPTILDMSRSDTFGQQSQRQKDIRENVALVFNATNQEVNLTGSDSISGRETSETQYKMEREKGIWPLVKLIQRGWTRDIIPYRYGFGYSYEFKASLSEWEQSELDTAKQNGRSHSVNEIRIARGDEPYPESKYDRPDGVEPIVPDGSEASPMNVRNIQ